SHAPLAIGNLVGGSGQEDPHVIPGLLGGERRLAQAIVNLLELFAREGIEAALLAPGDDYSTRHCFPKLRGQDETPLIVELRLICAKEHVTSHLPVSAR